MFVHLPDFCTTLKPCLKPYPGDLFPHLGTAWWPTSSSKSRPIPSSEGQQRKEMQPSVLASHCHHWPVLVQIQPQTSTNYREMEKPPPSASLRELPMGRRLHQLAGLTSTTPPQFKALKSKPLPHIATSPTVQCCLVCLQGQQLSLACPVYLRRVPAQTSRCPGLHCPSWAT